MKTWQLLAGMTATLCSLAAGPAAGESKKDSQTAEKDIRQTAEEFTAAFNHGDARAVAALWTPDGEYVDEGGNVTKGREAIAKAYAAFFKEHPKAQMGVSIHSIRFLSPDAAIED